jgi:hypothetical protein
VQADSGRWKGRSSEKPKDKPVFDGQAQSYAMLSFEHEMKQALQDPILQKHLRAQRDRLKGVLSNELQRLKHHKRRRIEVEEGELVE